MKFEEKKLTGEIKYEGKVVVVERDEVELSDGHCSFREVVRHSGGVVVLAFKDEETILLVKQFRYPIRETVFELPAGKLEKGEDPNLASKRELEEETGYRAKTWRNLGKIYTSPGYSDETLYLYEARDLEFVGEHPDEGEIISAYEYKLSDVKKMIKSGEINDAKTLCAIMRAELDD